MNRLAILLCNRTDKTVATFRLQDAPGTTQPGAFFIGTHIQIIMQIPPGEELSHRQLSEELARYKNMALTEVPLGAMWENRNRTPRADVLEVKPSYEDFIVTIYEIKKTRADFLSDIRSEKWKAYLPHCNRFYFACLKGICSKDEIPDGVGLMLRNENGWYTPRAGDYYNHDIPIETMKAIMFQRVKQELNQRRRKQIAQEYRVHGQLKSAGKEVNKALIFYRNWSWQIEKLKEEGLI